MVAISAMFVNFSAKEINGSIVVFAAQKALVDDYFQAALKLYAPGRGIDSAVVTLEGQKLPLFSFLPPGLGKIRDFAVRLNLYAVDLSTPPSLLSVTMPSAGAVVVLLQGADDPLNHWRQTNAAFAAAGGSWERTLAVIVLEAGRMAAASTDWALPKNSLLVPA